MDFDFDGKAEWVEKMLSGASEEELQQMAVRGRARVEQYCDGALEDIETIRTLVSLDDMADTMDPMARHAVLRAHSAAMNIVANYSRLVRVLEPLARQSAIMENEGE